MPFVEGDTAAWRLLASLSNAALLPLLVTTWLHYSVAGIEFIFAAALAVASTGNHLCWTYEEHLFDRTCGYWHSFDGFYALALAVFILVWLAFPLGSPWRYPVCVVALAPLAASSAVGWPMRDEGTRVRYFFVLTVPYLLAVWYTRAWRRFPPVGSVMLALSLAALGGLCNLGARVYPPYYYPLHMGWHVFIFAAPYVVVFARLHLRRSPTQTL